MQYGRHCGGKSSSGICNPRLDCGGKSSSAICKSRRCSGKTYSCKCNTGGHGGVDITEIK
ncbi:MAG: hypothetical protein J6B32_02230 [Spirochaetaceae bacterium]|nr:hypothetical protein [Spirochaetaceae bacterium]